MAGRIACGTLVMAVVLFVAGCGAQKGKTVFTASPNSGTVVGTAPETGTYALYSATNANPTMIVNLKEGDVLGFRKADDGRIEAVWKDQHYAFAKETAQVYWKLEGK